MFLDNWQNLHKILLVRLDTIGDLLMTSPAIRAIKETNPKIEITLLTSSKASEAAKLLPEINETIVFDAPWVSNENPFDPRLLEKITKNLEHKGFEAAIIFNVYSQNPLPSALLLSSAKITRRLSYSHENPYSLLSHWIPDPEPQKFIRHEVYRQLDLVKKVGFETKKDHLKVSIPTRDKVFVKQLLSSLKIDGFIILHPGASEERRRFRDESFVELGKKLINKTGLKILITGSQKENPLARKLKMGIGEKSLSLSGELTLSQFAALVSLANLVITNNTATSHFAAALSTPEVVFYANTNPQHTPWKNKFSKVFFFTTPCKSCERGICPGIHFKIKKEPEINDVIGQTFSLLESRKGQLL